MVRMGSTLVCGNPALGMLAHTIRSEMELMQAASTWLHHYRTANVPTQYGRLAIAHSGKPQHSEVPNNLASFTLRRTRASNWNVGNITKWSCQGREPLIISCPQEQQNQFSQHKPQAAYLIFWLGKYTVVMSSHTNAGEYIWHYFIYTTSSTIYTPMYIPLERSVIFLQSSTTYCMQVAV